MSDLEIIIFTSSSALLAVSGAYVRGVCNVALAYTREYPLTHWKGTLPKFLGFVGTLSMREIYIDAVREPKAFVARHREEFKRYFTSYTHQQNPF